MGHRLECAHRLCPLDYPWSQSQLHIKPPRKSKAVVPKVFSYSSYSEKLGDGLFPKWSRRHFALDDGILVYYADDKKQKKNQILVGDIQNVTILDSHASKTCVLMIVTIDKPIYLYDDSPAVTQRWLTILLDNKRQLDSKKAFRL